jgi:sialate O-acetylesterase
VSANYPHIRLLSADLNFSNQALDTFRGRWRVCRPATAKDFSAVGYSFGRDLYKALNIPVGLVFSGIGASAAQAYVPQDVLAADTMLNRVYLAPYMASEKSREKIDGGFSFEKVTRPFLLYNAMIAPFRHMGMRGICWYQGESNRMERGTYTHLMHEMIRSWRKEFGRPDLPFYYVQVAPYFYENNDSTLADYAFFREAQEKISELNNTAMVVTMDVGEARDLHPKNKIPIGHRLAYTALNRTYGRLDTAYRGPIFHHLEVSGNKALVYFQPGTAEALTTNDGMAPRHFFIAGEDRRFYEASAVIRENMIQLHSPRVKAPVAVRYAFTNFPVTNLENGKGLPAVPFRTDDFAEGSVL